MHGELGEVDGHLFDEVALYFTLCSRQLIESKIELLEEFFLALFALLSQLKILVAPESIFLFLVSFRFGHYLDIEDVHQEHF